MELTDIASPEEIAALAEESGQSIISASIAAAYPEQSHVQIEAEIQELFDAAKVDLNLLASICVPHVFRFKYPPVFLAAWDWVTRHAHGYRTFPKLALGLPRGFGKTMVIKLFILYCLFYTQKQYILVFGAREDLAVNIIEDIGNVLNSDNVRAIYGDWTLAKDQDTQTKKRFYFRGRSVTLQAAGAGTAIRGTNIHDVRPDVIVFDDIQKREIADSEAESDKLKTWMLGTAMLLRDPRGCMYMFLANMYPTPHSMLRWLNENPDWYKFITGAVLADGSSLWPELFPIDMLLKDFRSYTLAGRAEIFMSELMNDPNAVTNTAINADLLKPVTPPPGTPHQGSFIVIDPSTGKKGRDPVAIGYAEVHDDVPIMMDLAVGEFSPGDTIKEAFKLCMKHNCNLILVESVAYQQTLLWWFQTCAEQLGIHGIFFEPIQPGTGSKNSRIAEMFKAWMAGEVAVNDKCWNQVLNEALQFNFARRDNRDDILDLLCYLIKARTQFADFLASQAIQAIQTSSQHKRLTVEELSSF